MKAYIYSRHHVVITTSLLLLVVYMFVVLLPVAKGNVIIGFSGKIIGSQYIIQNVLTDSPADLAGLQVNDQVKSADRQSIANLHAEYTKGFSTYIDSVSGWRDRTVIFEIRRKGETFDVSIMPRQITFAEGTQFFGRRLLFCLFLLSMTVIILVSRTKSRDTLLFSACFIFIALWLCSGTRYWPSLLSPLIPDFQSPLFYVQELVADAALQLVCSCLLLISLVFPRKQEIIQKYPRLDIMILVVPLITLAVVMVMSRGTFMERLQDIYSFRLGFNSVVVVCAVMLMIRNYRYCESTVEKEQSRWIIASFAVSVFAIVSLWNVPTMITGSALIKEFDWLLIPFALIPLSMTIAINNHRLFGVRGILGYRLKVLETRLEREKKMVRGRDQRIHSLDTELENLRTELKEFSVAEKIDSTVKDDTNSKLVDLETRFPELTKIRMEKLLGTSPVWINVFEDVVLASYGLTPVLICGESGTGKTELARAIHNLSDRKYENYKEVSCAQFEHSDPAISLGRLFGIGPGHGLSNVPREGQPGLLEECNMGTLFLDDFDCLPNNVQNLLLYPLEGKPYEPGIGKGSARQVSIKFILATNRDPGLLVSSGQFRSDVLARLESRITIPPLRDRKEDIDVLIAHFTEQLSLELQNQVSGVSDKARNLLNQDGYTNGNARQLKSELRHAMGKAMLEGDTIIRAGYLSDRFVSPTAPKTVIETVANTIEESSAHQADDGTFRELTVLRNNRFRMEPSERELGLSHKSKTLSNYLRGQCIQVLYEHNWEIAPATREIVGSDDPLLIKKIEGKISRYLANIKKSIGNGTEGKLYNNLPAKYHPALTRTIKQFRSE